MGVTRMRTVGGDDAWTAADEAVRRLAAALDQAGIVLPSLSTDRYPTLSGMVLVDLGRARPDTVRRLAAAVARGARR